MKTVSPDPLKVRLSRPMIPRRTWLFAAGAFAATIAVGRKPKAETRRAAKAPAPRSLWLYHAGTRETFRGEYHDGAAIIPAARERLNHFLRDHHENSEIGMDPALFDLIHRFQARLWALGYGRNPLWVHSAYRTQRTNDRLRREGAAHNSQHLLGKAVDLSVPGHGIDNYERVALASATGGVGIYSWDHFVHFDTGPRRGWTQPR